MLAFAIIVACCFGFLDGLKKLNGPTRVKSSNNLVEYLFLDY